MQNTQSHHGHTHYIPAFMKIITNKLTKKKLSKNNILMAYTRGNILIIHIHFINLKKNQNKTNKNSEHQFFYRIFVSVCKDRKRKKR